MEQAAKIIDLTFNRKDFEEIYFRDNQDSIFVGPAIKRDFIAFVVALLFLGGSTGYSLMTDKSAWLIVLSAIATTGFFIHYCIKAFQIQQWRRSITDFLNKNENFKVQKLILTESSFSLIQDGNENIHKWSSFTHAEVNESYLMLTGGAQYLIPKKAMPTEDYNYLILEVKARLQSSL